MFTFRVLQIGNPAISNTNNVNQKLPIPGHQSHIIGGFPNPAILPFRELPYRSNLRSSQYRYWKIYFSDKSQILYRKVTNPNTLGLITKSVGDTIQGLIAGSCAMKRYGIGLVVSQRSIQSYWGLTYLPNTGLGSGIMKDC